MTYYSTHVNISVLAKANMFFETKLAKTNEGSRDHYFFQNRLANTNKEYSKFVFYVVNTTNLTLKLKVYTYTYTYICMG